MRVGIPTETLPGEQRVATVPASVATLIKLGAEVVVQRGAGAAAGYPDDSYAAQGAGLESSAEAVFGGCDVVAKIQGPSPAEAELIRADAALIGLWTPGRCLPVVRILAARGVSSFSLELLPRTSRAQGMDVLSSQATVAGYRGVLLAAGKLPRFFPLLMTAAGTVPPAKVLVLGAGVAGLQAIATARRLGAVVSAYDVRAASRGEVESLGARFVQLDLATAEGEGGYAAEQAEDAQRRQREALSPAVAEADVVLTTAQIPGRRAPILLTGDMVAGMKPGSVVVDLASDSGGNCDVSRPGEEVDHHGVAVIGVANPASGLATHASQMFARNLTNLFAIMIRDGQWAPDFDDDIVAATCVTRGGEIVHDATRLLIEEDATS